MVRIKSFKYPHNIRPIICGKLWFVIRNIVFSLFLFFISVPKIIKSLKSSIERVIYLCLMLLFAVALHIIKNVLNIFKLRNVS